MNLDFRILNKKNKLKLDPSTWTCLGLGWWVRGREPWKDIVDPFLAGDRSKRSASQGLARPFAMQSAGCTDSFLITLLFSFLFFSIHANAQGFIKTKVPPMQMPQTQDGRQPVGQEVQEPKNPKIQQAAEMYETQFLRDMLRAMRKTVPESDLMPMSGAERLFRDQLDDHNVDQWVARGGVGLSGIIYDQIIEKYGRGRPMPRGKGAPPRRQASSH